MYFRKSSIEIVRDMSISPSTLVLGDIGGKNLQKLSIIRVLLSRSKYSLPDGPMTFFGLHIWWVNDLEGYS